MFRFEVAGKLEELAEVTRLASMLVPNDSAVSIRNYTTHERKAVQSMLKRGKELMNEILKDAEA
jgi:hypothetical protein